MWKFLFLASLTIAFAEESCYAPQAHVYPTDKDNLKIEHALHFTKAVISKPAPEFSGTAVVDGKFKKISLKDYLGKYVVFFFYPLDFTFVSDLIK
jgi:peroxiredoxin (alkyl hydroperoxide reductase subunit C)